MTKGKLNALYEKEAERLKKLEVKDDGDYLNPVFGTGAANAKLMLIGEAPGKEEAAQHTPFVGKAGKQLDELMGLAGINRQNVFVTNAVKFRPVKKKEKSVANRTPTKTEIEEGLPLLAEEIKLVCPNIIATLGNTPLFAISRLSGENAGTVGTVHGKPLDININGTIVTLFPLYHPASGIYNRNLINVMENDAKKLGELYQNLIGL